MQEDLHIFLSDVHLGLRNGNWSKREKNFADYLANLPTNTHSLYLLGDIFDFWYEYKYVIPCGYTRVLGRLAELVDRGVNVYFFKGNHDLWVYNYFEKEIGIKILEQPSVLEINGKLFCLGHGDGLGYTPLSFRFLRGIFHSRFLQICFSSLHPRWALAFGYTWSRHTRLAKASKSTQYKFRGKDEPIYKFSEKFYDDYFHINNKKIDYFIFGHFHESVSMKLKEYADFFILNDWVKEPYNSLVFDGNKCVKLTKSPVIEGI